MKLNDLVVEVNLLPPTLPSFTWFQKSFKIAPTVSSFSVDDVYAVSVETVTSIPNDFNLANDTPPNSSLDVNDDKLYKMYRDLDELETIMQQYKGRGYEFSTINELKKANTNTRLEQVMAKLNRLYGVKENPYIYTVRGHGK